MFISKRLACGVIVLLITLNAEAKKKKKSTQLTTSDYEYMIKYGWYPSGVQHDPQSGASSLASMQLFAGLEPTGIMNDETRELIATPRCGNRDIFGANQMHGPPNRAKRYAASSYVWSKTDLKYYFENFSSRLTAEETRDAIQRAFDLWAEHSPLTFQETEDIATTDFIITFATGDHGDGIHNAFDGPRGTLGHAYYPEDGRAHFDDDEDFTVGSHNGVNLYIVAAHEFGHAFGLGHSDVQGSLMYPWYQGYVENYQLPQDDIQGIQQMYGMPPEDEAPAPPGASPNQRSGDNLPDTCTSSWDAVDTSFDGKVFAFKGKYLWRIKNNGAANGFPKKITSFYKRAPSNVDAVVTSRVNQKTYIFKGNRYWRYTNYKLDANFPKKLKPTGLPKSVSAAFVWGGNGKIHIFKGNHFYIFNERTEKIKGGKRTIRDKWHGIPTSVTSAFQWKNGKTYFFRGDKYWRFDDSTLQKERGYPKSKALYWMGCGATPDLPEPIRVLPEENEERN